MAMTSADHMTSADAARALGVSRRQVQRLTGTGELTEVARVGSNILLDARSVHRLAERGSRRGRPWTEETAWAAVELLDAGNTSRLSPSQRSRLRVKLRSIDADEFVRLARRRAETVRFRSMSSSSLERLRAQATLTGSAAISADRRTAAEFNLVGGDETGVDGYVPRELLDAYQQEFFLASDHNGDVVLRAIGDDTRARRLATTTVIALDLTESLDPRERSAGLRVLADKIGQWT